MTSKSTTTDEQQQHQQPPTRRHIERPTRVWPFVMESLAENEAETAGTESQQVVSRAPEASKAAVVEQQPQPGCAAPFFGVKHYLNNFYGLPDDESSSAKVWRQIQAESEEDYYALLTAGQSKSDVECWHVHRRCFAWSVSLGTVIILIGVTCLLLGFLLPRHPVLIGQVEENDLKTWISAHSPGSNFNLGDTSITSLNILDRKAVEYNSTLDILKVGGLMGTCLGVLLLVVALIFPPGRHPSTWIEDDSTPHVSKINQALKNCIRSVQLKNNPTFFYSGLVASTTEEKIPVFQKVHSVQPQN